MALWRVQIELEEAEKDHSEAEEYLDWPWRLGSKEPRWVLMRPWGDREGSQVKIEKAHIKAEEKLDVAEVHYTSHGTNVKSEKAHINAEEMLDAAEVHYTCFAEKIHDEAEVAFDRQWMCQGGLQAKLDYGSKLGVQKDYMKPRPN
uniref:Uncharacterized protein n=1 Tax=Fagus sylvatica TaxID=28930 RepID=A0A2N9J783_FAGSY